MKSQRGKKIDMSDWENRVLCIDGNCIGVIGTDGRCKECGKPYKGELPFSSTESVSDDQIQADESEPGPANDSDGGTTEPVAQTRSENDDLDWENRKLCSDGNCIGVIGPDGNCKECGKPFSGDPE